MEQKQKVRCVHRDHLECFLKALSKQCWHFYPHDRYIDCDISVCDTFHNCDCVVEEKDETTTEI